MLSSGDHIFVCNLGPEPVWLSGVIVGCQGAAASHVSLKDGRIIRRHTDHIRRRYCSDTLEEGPTEDSDSLVAPQRPSMDMSATDLAPATTAAEPVSRPTAVTGTTLRHHQGYATHLIVLCD